MSALAKCRACGAPITFIKTVKGKTMPVDALPVMFVPDLNGPNFYVTGEGYVLHGCEPRPGEVEATEAGYISHFATCPSADAFRKRRKSGRK